MTDRKTDIFLDLTGLDPGSPLARETVDALSAPDGLGAILGNLTCVLPDSDRDPIAAANDAIQEAAVSGRDLLTLLGPVVPGYEAVGVLTEIFSKDPHFGFSFPRHADPSGLEILKLREDLGDPEIKTIPRRALQEMDEFYILPEILSACFLVRNRLLVNLSLLDDKYETLAGAWKHYLCHARRCGFRGVVANRAVVPAPRDEKACELSLSKADVLRLHHDHPDTARAKVEMGNQAFHLGESLLARAYSRDGNLRRTLLIDARGVPDFFNGTADAALNLAHGLRQVQGDWKIAMLAKPKCARFHKLSELFPGWEILEDTGSRCFTVALRPSQPWHISTMIELHRMALVNIYAMLDTISWDVLFNAPRSLNGTWQFLADHADGVIYLSDYTRDRFRMRFPAVRTKQEYVYYLSFHPKDYRDDSILNGGATEPFFLVLGNDYDHKNVALTVDLLTTAFPFRNIKALGLSSHANPRVEALSSGRVPQAEIDRLFAHTELLVFPSFYEGFGLPVLKGLSYGRTVLARRSGLVLELAAHYRGPGRLVTFDSPAELAEMAGRILHGEDVPTVPLGTALAEAQEPMSWVDVARGVLHFAGKCAENPGAAQWRSREKAIEQILAYTW